MRCPAQHAQSAGERVVGSLTRRLLGDLNRQHDVQLSLAWTVAPIHAERLTLEALRSATRTLLENSLAGPVSQSAIGD
jgi:hypothetical protein